jgi:hypothetical protein
MTRIDALEMYRRHHEAMRWLLRVAREARTYGYHAAALQAVRESAKDSRRLASRALAHLREAA